MYILESVFSKIYFDISKNIQQPSSTLILLLLIDATMQYSESKNLCKPNILEREVNKQKNKQTRFLFRRM